MNGLIKKLYRIIFTTPVVELQLVSINGKNNRQFKVSL
jgi:hypothetical protein